MIKLSRAGDCQQKDNQCTPYVDTLSFDYHCHPARVKGCKKGDNPYVCTVTGKNFGPLHPTCGCYCAATPKAGK